MGKEDDGAGAAGAGVAAGTGTGGTGDAAAAAAAAAAGGDKGAAGGDDKGGGDAAGALAARRAAAKGGDKGGEPAADGRPADVPEAFWDPAKKEVRQDAMLKSWRDTSAQLRTLQGSKGVKPPEKPEGYTFERAKDLPAHILADAGKDESLKLLRNVAHAAGLTQEQFSKLATEYYAGAAKLLPAPPDAKAEIAKLGVNGEKVADTVITWLEGFETSGLLSGVEVDALVLQGATADGIRALNKLRENFGGAQIPVHATVDGLPSKDELYKLTHDDRYTGKNGKGDDAFRAKVKAQFEAVYGTQAAGTSEGGRV